MFRKQYKENQKVSILQYERRWVLQNNEEQVNSIEDFSSQYDHILQLTLINHDHIDHQYIEKIKNATTVFNQIESLDICFDGIDNLQDDEEMIHHLFSVFQVFTNLKQFILSLNKIQMNSSIIKAIGQFVQTKDQLQYLSLHFQESNINTQYLEDLSNQISPVRNSLEVFSLDISCNQINKEGAYHIAQFIKQCSQLRMIQLIATRNIIASKGANLLTKALYYCPNLTHIELDFSYDFSIDRLEVLSIGQIFSRCQSLKYLNLNVFHIHLENSVLKRLTQFISSYLNQIESFNFQMNDNGFTAESIQSFAQALAQCSTLKEINISFKNNLQTYSFMIFYSMFKNNSIKLENLSTLRGSAFKKNVILNEELNLDFQHNGIGESGTATLSVMLNQIQKLKGLSINLSENHIGNKGMVDLSQSLQMDPSYFQKLQFDFSFNYIGFQGIKSLSDYIAKCENLKVVSLSFEKVGLFDNEISPLIDLFLKLKKLEQVTLNFKDNVKLSLNMIIRIIQQFKKFKFIRFFDLQYQCRFRQIDHFGLLIQQQINNILYKLPRNVIILNK